MLEKTAKFVLWLVDIILFGVLLSSLVSTLDILSAMQMFWGRNNEGSEVSYQRIFM
jgi:hypothetical protein